MENKGIEVDEHSPPSPLSLSTVSDAPSSTTTVARVRGNNAPDRPQNRSWGESTVKMTRHIGLIGGIAMIVGTMIGSGIFITPNVVFWHTAGSISISLMVWIASGLLSTLTALTYCELGTVVPRSGGEHAYFQAAFKPLHEFWGEVPAFLFGFMTVTLLKPSSMAVQSLSFAQYTILPLLEILDVEPTWMESMEHEVAQKLIAVTCATLVASVNILSSKLSSRVQIVFTIAKLLACCLIIGIGIYNLSVGVTGSIPDGFDAYPVTPGGMALAFYSGLWSYDGWNNLNYLTEELVNPKRNLPLAIFIGISLTTVFYTFMNVAYFTVLTPNEFLSGQPIGVLVGDRMLGSFSVIVPILVAMSVLGTANGSMFTAARISYVTARDGHLVDVLSYVHLRRLTPSLAIILNTVLSIVYISFSSINKLIDSFSIASNIFYSLSMVSFFILRRRQPDAERPFRVLAILPVIALLITSFLVIAPIVDHPGVEHIYPLGFCVLGVLLYIPFVYKKYSWRYIRSVTVFLQKVTLLAPSPYKAD